MPAPVPRCPNGHQMRLVGRTKMVQCPTCGWVQQAGTPNVIEHANSIKTVTPDEASALIKGSLALGRAAGENSQHQKVVGRAVELAGAGKIADAVATIRDDTTMTEGQKEAAITALQRLDETSKGLDAGLAGPPGDLTYRQVMDEIDRQAWLLYHQGVMPEIIHASQRAYDALVRAISSGETDDPDSGKERAYWKERKPFRVEVLGMGYLTLVADARDDRDIDVGGFMPTNAVAGQPRRWFSQSSIDDPDNATDE